MEQLYQLESKDVFKFFKEISNIPRPSYKEEQIANYLINFAKERGLEYYTDELFNVIIKKAGTFHLKNAPTVAIQNHIDMVCEKNKVVEHDFLKDPIKLIRDGDFIKADGTTLGADNGIGVAMCLALLDSKNINHPPLEAIFTSSEESGMEGATFLDCTKINSKILLNIDSEEEGVFTVGCAGGSKAEIELPIKKENTVKEFSSYLLTIKGLFGGHSGLHITKGRANANKLLIRILKEINDKFQIQLNYISGGSKDNAITRESEAIISFNQNDFINIEHFVNNYKEKLILEYINVDENLEITLEKVNNLDKAFEKESFEKVISAIYLLPNGVYSMSSSLTDLPESSMNIGVVETLEDKVFIVASIRSALPSKKTELINKITILMSILNGKATFRGDYPAWEYNKNSKLKQKCVEVYKEMTEQEPKIEITHAGLECGLIFEKLPGIDIISFGPNIYNPHSPNETVSISSVDRVWKFLLNLLEKLN